MRTRTSIRLCALLAALFTLQGVLHVAIRVPAEAAAPPLQRITGMKSTPGADPAKSTAYCPLGTRVVSGGGSVDDHGTGKVMLTRLEPIRQEPNPPLRDSYEAWAQATDTVLAGSWTVQAYAICASGKGLPANLGNYRTNTVPTSGPFQALALRCPSASQRVISAGTTTIYNASGVPAGVQLARVSDPLDVARSTAHVVGGFAGLWRLTSIAMCADPIKGASAVSHVVNDGHDSVTCPDGTKVYGAGAGGSLTDSGEAFLRSLDVSANLRTVTASFTTPLIGGMVVQATCVPNP